MMKSSAYLIRFTFAFRLRLLAFGYFSRRRASRPSSVMFAKTGEQIPPCGVPSSVGCRTCFSINPAFSHFCRIVVSIGICVRNQSWLIRLKHDVMSPSSIHLAAARLLRTVCTWPMASAQDRSRRNPKEFGSAWTSAMGSRASR